ncbi:MAG: hypothetical protein PUE67_06045 [Oscillospiraceae bacterium]|nr:hypothetical protein [Oscillospiraceae bacterium]
MNYKLWAEEYLKDAQKIKSAIDKEKENLKNAKKFDETQEINRRIQILKSMYYECKLTASLLSGKECEQVA